MKGIEKWAGGKNKSRTKQYVHTMYVNKPEIIE